MRRVLTVIFITLFIVIVGEMGYYFFFLTPNVRSSGTESSSSSPTPTPFNLSNPETYSMNRYVLSQTFLREHMINKLEIVYHISAKVTEVDAVPGDTGVEGMFEIKDKKPSPAPDAQKEHYLFRIYLTGTGENNKGQEYVYYHKTSHQNLVQFVEKRNGVERVIKGTDLKKNDLVETTHIYDMTKPDNYSSLVSVKFARIKDNF